MSKRRTYIAIIFVVAVAVFAAGAYVGWMSRPAKKPKVVLLGMDGMTWSILDPMLKKGELPNFQTLIDRGVRGEFKTLKSTYISASIWTTILTGKLPKYHGIDGWFTTKGFAVNSTNRTVKFLPQMLSEKGITSATVGFMATWPADQVNGWIVSDLASYGRFKDASETANKSVHDYTYLKKIKRVTWPEDLLDEILPVMKSPSEVPEKVYKTVLPMSDTQWDKFDKIDTIVRDDDSSLLKFSVATDYNFYLAGKEILERHGPEVYMVYFEGTDISEHFFWKYMEPQYFKNDVTEEGVARYGHVIENYYRFMDNILGDVVKEVGEDAIIIVCSDHGMERVEYMGQDGPHSGQHRINKPPGIIIMAGKGVKKGEELKGAVVVDVTPTILWIEGLPVGKDMHGKPLLDAFTDDFKADHPVKIIDSWEGDAQPKEEVISPLDDQIKQRLKAIGYIE